MHLHETDPAPRWPQGPGRTAAQRAAAVFLLAASPASAAYWALHGLPDGVPMPTPLLLCLLAMAPVGLWLLLACPPLRPQRPDELAVFHAGWPTPMGVGLVVLCAGFAAALPALLTGDDLVAGLVMELLLLVWLVLSALVVAAARNERLLLAADGRIEATGAGGRTRIAELHEAASLRVTLLGTYHICDAEGRTLCTFEKDAVNCKRLLARLQQRGIGFATPHDQARASRFPLPKVRATLDWDEADRTPAHRWLPLLRRAWVLAVALTAAQVLLTRSAGVLTLADALLLSAWPPAVFYLLYLLFPQVYVWDYFPQRPRARQWNQVLATRAWQQNHPSLIWAFFPAAVACMSAVSCAESLAVADPVRLALLCAALAVVPAGACGLRMARQKVRSWLALGMFALALCFPMGYSLNLKLSAPTAHRTLPVVETLRYNSRVTDDGHTYALVCALDGARVKLAVDRDAWLQAQQDPVADVLVWESPLGIRLVQRAC